MHRPQLGQHHRYHHEAQTDVQTLVQPIQPRRSSRPIEGGQFEPANVDGNGLPKPRPVGDVGQQAGHDHDRQHHQQRRPEHRRQPGSTQRTAPPDPRESRRRVVVKCPPQHSGKPVAGRRRLGGNIRLGTRIGGGGSSRRWLSRRRSTRRRSRGHHVDAPSSTRVVNIAASWPKRVAAAFVGVVVNGANSGLYRQVHAGLGAPSSDDAEGAVAGPDDEVRVCGQRRVAVHGGAQVNV